MTRQKPEPPKPEDGVTLALRNLKRRQRRKRLIRLLILLLLLLVGGVFYLQSNHALTHFYLPMLGRQLGTTLTAESGTIGLGGAVELVNLEISGSDGSPAFHAGRVTLRAAPLSLLPGRTPLIREATLDGVQARLSVQENGATNWDFKPAPRKAAPRQASTPPQPKAAGITLHLPDVTVEKFKINNGAFQVERSQEGEQLMLTLTDTDLSLEQFGRGRDAIFGLNTVGALDRSAIHHRFSASGRGTLSQDASGRGLGWHGALDAKSAQSATTSTAQTTPVTIKTALEGKLTPAGRMEQTLTMTADTPQGPGGRVKGALVWDDATRERQATLAADGLGRELLNPFLALAGPLQLDRSQLTAACTLKGTGDSIAIESRVAGEGLVFRIGDAGEPTPPVSVDLTQRGALDTAKQRLRLDAASFALRQNGQPLLLTQLDQAVELDLGQGAAAAGGVTAHINTTLHELPVKALEPWLILSGVKAAREIGGGMVSGTMNVAIQNAGAAIALDGEFKGAALLLPGWGEVPIDITQTIKGRIEKLDTLNVDQSRTTFASYREMLAEVETGARFSIATGQGQATVRLRCPQAVHTARVLGWLSEGAVTIRQDGTLEAVEELKVAGKGKPAAISGTASLAGVVLAGGGATLPLAGKAAYRFTLTDAMLNVETLHAEWTAAGAAQPATADLKGNWPLAAGQAGELTLATRKIDLAPWLRLVAEPGAKGVATLPLEVDQALSIQVNGATHFTGDVRLGPLPAEGAAGDPAVALTARLEAERLGQKISKLALDLTGKTRSGATDKIAFAGSGEADEKSTAIKMTGKIDSLHADSYLALAGLLSAERGVRSAVKESSAGIMPASSTNPQSPAPRSTLPTPRSENPQSSSPRSALRAPRSENPKSMILEITPLEIGKLTYQGADLSELKGSFRFENGVSDIKLTQGRLNGGSIAGNAQFNAARQEPRYAWEVALRQIDIHALLAAIAPEQAAHFQGKGDIASNGSGEGLGEAAKRRLQSKTGFILTGGQISGFFLLDAVAQQTRVDQFKTIQYDEFSGQITTDQGVATLKDWIERGKEQRISLEGTVTLDGRYELLFRPAVTQKMAGKLGKNALAQQLLTDSQGFMSLPTQVAITGQGTQFQLGGRIAVDKGGNGTLDQNLRGVLKGVADQARQKGQGSKAGDAATSGNLKAPLPGLDQLQQQIQKRGSSKKDKKKEGPVGGINIKKIRIPGVN